MYAKLENNKLVYAPRNFKDENIILNFNKNTSLMKQYGFKEVIDIKPEYDNTTHYISVSGYVENENNIIINYVVNVIEENQEPTLEEQIAELKETNNEQDELINVSLCATDEMFVMLEPILEMFPQTINLVSKMADLYVAMVMRGLKTIEQVPARYREQVKEILAQLEK